LYIKHSRLYFFTFLLKTITILLSLLLLSLKALITGYFKFEKNYKNI